jgi:NYN domain
VSSRSEIERVRDLPLPNLRRWMLFVDGENLTARAQRVVKDAGVRLLEGRFYSRDTFVWIPYWPASSGMTVGGDNIPLQARGVRAYYYASVVGDQQKIRSVQEALFDMQFTPKVFKKPKNRPSKAVDITLATDMLGHAHRNDYDVAVLCAGDGDYVPLVEEVKRLGKGVRVAFFEGSGLSDELRLASDTVLYLDDLFLRWWKVHLERSLEEQS